jgi:hypothetical protein
MAQIFHLLKFAQTADLVNCYLISVILVNLPVVILLFFSIIFPFTFDKMKYFYNDRIDLKKMTRHFQILQNRQFSINVLIIFNIQ